MDSHAVAIAAPGLPASTPIRLGQKIEEAIGIVVEAVAAVILVAEVVILGAGVIARYVLYAPLVWSDELASILFLWLSMLGAVIALRRGEHMRMTGIVARVSPRTRALLEAVALAASIAILLLILPHAIEYAQEESFVVTPALEIVNTWRAAAIPTGIALMLLAAVLRLVRTTALRPALVAVALTASLIALFWIAGPMLKRCRCSSSWEA